MFFSLIINSFFISILYLIDGLDKIPNTFLIWLSTGVLIFSITQYIKKNTFIQTIYESGYIAANYAFLDIISRTLISFNLSLDIAVSLGLFLLILCFNLNGNKKHFVIGWGIYIFSKINIFIWLSLVHILGFIPSQIYLIISTLIVYYYLFFLKKSNPKNF